MFRKTLFIWFVVVLAGLLLITPLIQAQTSPSRQSILNSLSQQLINLRSQLTTLTTNRNSTVTATTCRFDSVPQQLLASDGAPSDFFGYSVAVSGDVALVGAKLDDDKGANAGSAYVFRWNGSSWIQEQKLFGSGQVAYDAFGSSVTINGDIAVVVAPGHFITGVATGATYVFRFNGSSWVEEQRLPVGNSGTPDIVIGSVSVSGNVIVVGASRDVTKGYYAGAAYVYRYNGSSWVQEQKLTASDGANVDFFGFSVGTSGSDIIIGAYGDDDRGSVSGSAYVFRFNGSSWVQQQKLVTSDGAAYDQFGSSVAIAGSTIVVGAYQDSSHGLGFGSAYVFRFNGSTWVQETELYASDGATNDYFGSTVAVSGNRVIVGAYKDDDKGSSSGSAYIFSFNGSTWSQETKLLDSNGASNDYFGYTVAVSGDRAMIGAYWDDNIRGADAGAAHVFTETCTEPPTTYALIVNTIGTGDGTTNPTGTVTYPANTVVPLAATANNNSTFTGWSGDADCADGSVTMTAPKTCFANFALKTFIINATAGVGGTITPSGNISVGYGGGLQIFPIVALPGYQIADVLVDGISVGAVTSYTFTNVQTVHTIAVSFSVLDNQAPTVTLTNPQASTPINQGATVAIIADATDNIGMKNVIFYINDRRQCVDSTSPYTCDWLVPTGRIVTFNLQAKGYDNAGNVGNSQIIKVKTSFLPSSPLDNTATLPVSPTTVPISSLVNADPPTGAVMAQAGSGPGWSSVLVNFSGATDNLGEEPFLLINAKPIDTLRILTVDIVNSTSARLNFSRPLLPGERVLLSHQPSNTSVCLGFLPGDVDQNGFATSADISLLNSWLPTATTAGTGANQPLWKTDINRDGAFNAQDITRAGEIMSAPDRVVRLPACPPRLALGETGPSTSLGSSPSVSGGLGATLGTKQLADALSALSPLWLWQILWQLFVR